MTVTSTVPTFIRYQPLACLPASGAAACVGPAGIDDAATAAAVPARNVRRLSSVMASPSLCAALLKRRHRNHHCMLGGRDQTNDASSGRCDHASMTRGSVRSAALL